MERPRSIIWFERLYLGVLAISGVNIVLNFSGVVSTIVGAVGAPTNSLPPMWILALAMAVEVWTKITLCLLVSRGRSNVAKIIIVAIYGVSLLGLPIFMSRAFDGAISPLMALKSFVQFFLNSAAVWMLFRPETKPWFDKKTPDLKDTFN